MSDRWQYVAVRRDPSAGTWVVRGPVPVEVPDEDDVLILANVIGAQGWRLVDRQPLKDFRGGPSIELLFTRPLPPGPPAAPAEAAVPADEEAGADAEVTDGDAPFGLTP